MLSPNVRGLLPFYHEKPCYSVAPICTDGSTPPFLLKGSIPSAIIINVETNSFVIGMAGSVTTVTKNGQTEQFSFFPPSSLPNGLYRILYTDSNGASFTSENIEVNNCKSPWKIKAELTCDNLTLGPTGTIVELPIDVVSVIQVSPEVLSQEKLDNGFGQTKVDFYKHRDVYSMDLCFSVGLNQVFGLLKLYDKVTICNPNGAEWEIDPNSIESSFGQSLIGVGSGTVNFSYADAWICKDSCDCVEIEQEFEDDCVEPGGDACDDWGIEITESGGVITVDTTGTVPPGASSIIWSINGSYATTGSTINTNNVPGSYSVQVTYAGCPPKFDAYTIIDPCSQFSIQGTAAGDKIDAVANGVPDGETVQWEVCNEDGDIVSTTLPYTATDSGFYTIKGKTSETCCLQQTSVFVSDDGCDHDLTVDNDGTTLTVNVTGTTSPISYLWEQQDENGNVTTVGTGQTLTPTETGLYWANAIVDGCIKRIPVFFKADDDCLNVIVKNAADFPVSTATYEPIINVAPPEVTVINNIDACCEEDCTPCSFNLVCVAVEPGNAAAGATLTIQPTGGCDSATFEVTDPNNNSLGQGLSYLLTTKGIHTITIDNGDCSDSQTYDFCLPEAGSPNSNAPILTPVNDI